MWVIEEKNANANDFRVGAFLKCLLNKDNKSTNTELMAISEPKESSL